MPLDREIPEALRRAVRGIAAGPEAGEPAQGTDPGILGASHRQCLGALDLLEAEYGKASVSEAAGLPAWDVRGETMEELLVRSARDEVVTTVQVLKAMHREWTQLDRRVRELELAAHDGKPGSAP